MIKKYFNKNAIVSIQVIEEREYDWRPIKIFGVQINSNLPPDKFMHKGKAYSRAGVIIQYSDGTILHRLFSSNSRADNYAIDMMANRNDFDII